MAPDVLQQQLGGSERRVLVSGPPPESLLCRLDQIDLRLRQLEERRAHAAGAQHQHTRSLPSSALQLRVVRGAAGLMDRLDLLESRIRQIGCELDLDAGGGAVVRAEDDVREPAPMPEPCREPPPPPPPLTKLQSAAAEDGTSWGARQLLHRDRRPDPSSKVKSMKEAKCACQKKEAEKEKRKKKKKKTERNRRWFGVGC